MWLRGRYSLPCLKVAAKSSKSSCIAYSFSDISHKKNKIAPLQERRMIDRFRLWAKGGEGGNGCSSFRRSRHDRRRKPDGGNGGRGGDVILECSAAVWDFSGLQHHNNAKRGGNGAPKNMIGSRGSDKVVPVPVGTVIHLVEGEISSSVDKKSPVSLDPWDVLGVLDVGSSESSQLSVVEQSKNMENTNCIDEELARSSEQTSKETVCAQLEVFRQLSTFKKRYRNPSKMISLLDSEASTESDPSDAEMNFSEAVSEKESTDTEQMQYNVAELTEPGQQLIVARGGEGGLGSSHSVCKDNDNSSAKDSINDDRMLLNIGFPGSEVRLLLELKSIADVGLVGMPNAGKSTLLGAISRAKPTVGHYAFTTLRPNLGKLNFDDISIVVADIPGLVSGAHENRGLGHAFLRHIERSRVLAYVVDLSAALDGRKGIPPWEQLKNLLLELEFYSQGLSSRPSVIVANKIDEAGAEEVYQDLRRRVADIQIYPVCAVLGEGIPELKAGLKTLVTGEKWWSLKIDNIILD